MFEFAVSKRLDIPQCSNWTQPHSDIIPELREMPVSNADGVAEVLTQPVSARRRRADG